MSEEKKLQGRFKQALLDPNSPVPGEVQVWDGSDPQKRFAVHRNNTVYALVEALVATFPVVQELVGEQFFAAMAKEFVRSSPPETPVLATYGRYFADFISEFRPAASVPYLADVARLEYARLSAFHAADAPVLTAIDPQLAGADGCVEHLLLRLHPSARLVQGEFASYSIWAAHNGVGRLEEVDVDLPEASLVSRMGDEVLITRLTTGGAAFVRSLSEQCDLGEAASRALQLEEGLSIGPLLVAMLRQHSLTSVQFSKARLQ